MCLYGDEIYHAQVKIKFMLCYGMLLNKGCHTCIDLNDLARTLFKIPHPDNNVYTVDSRYLDLAYLVVKILSLP